MSIRVARALTAVTLSGPVENCAYQRGPIARAIVPIGIGCISLCALLSLVVSVLPGGAVFDRLLGVIGDARASAATADVAAHLAERLRLLGILLLAASACLFVLRVRLAELLDALIADVRALRWPARTDVLAALGVTALAVAMRLPFAFQPMRYDEAMTFNDFASRPLHYGLSYYPDPNNHILNTLLVHIAFVLFGNQPLVIRLPALVAGALVAPTTYVLAHVLYDRRVAVVAAALVAVASYVIQYSTNARGYTLVTVCFLGLAACVVLAAKRDRLSVLFPASVVAALGAFAVPTMVYGVVVVAAWFGALRLAGRVAASRVRIGHLVASAGLLGTFSLLAYAPVIVVSGPDRLIANRYVASLNGSDLVRELPASLGRTWSDFNQDVPLAIVPVLAIGFALATVDDVRRRQVPLGLLAALVCLACVLVQRVAPFERVWLFLLPLYLIVATAGLATLARGRLGSVFGGIVALGALGAIVVTTLTSGSIAASPETGLFTDAETVARLLGPRLQASDAVLSDVPASAPQLEYYFARNGFGVDPLRRSPEGARTLYVVAPPGETPQVAGWTNPQPIAQLSSSQIVKLERSSS